MQRLQAFDIFPHSAAPRPTTHLEINTRSQPLTLIWPPPTGELNPLDATFTKNGGEVKSPRLSRKLHPIPAERKPVLHSACSGRTPSGSRSFPPPIQFGLQDHVAIVAAASKGLGRAVAEELAREGASVAICARTASELEQAAAQIQKSTGREVFYQPVDVTNPAAVSHFVAAVDDRFGRLDICVTNSGGLPSKPFVDTKPEDWRAAVDLLLMSTVFFAKEALPRMQKNKWGRFITITSSAVKQPVDGLLLSNSIRAAVAGLARTLANEYAAHGITVNNVCPGYTRSARLDNLAATISARTGAQPEAVFADWTSRIPAGRIGTPQEFAAVVAFLASERASYVNGTSTAVDGGMVRSLL
jgi:3-oxoacyl-[acyl-carrier protein] reductase